MKKLLALFCLLSTPGFGQSSDGELRLRVFDPSGLGINSKVELTSEVSQYHAVFMTDDSGNLTARRLPHGVFRLLVQHEGFASASESVEVRSAVPLEIAVKLTVAPLSTAVT